jgi:urease accessory protein
MATQWLLWQLADSAFPAGGFVHSGGLESAWQSGMIGRDDDLDALFTSLLRQSARAIAPFAAATCAEPDRFREADHVCNAMLSNHVANRASRAQGQATLASAERIFQVERLSDFAANARHGHALLHFGPVFGVVAAALDVDVIEATKLFVYVNLRGLVSAAVRLGIVGPLEAQSIQGRLAPEAERCAEIALGTPVDDAVQIAPLFEIAQGCQDRLYSRLFQS